MWIHSIVLERTFAVSKKIRYMYIIHNNFFKYFTTLSWLLFFIFWRNMISDINSFRDRISPFADAAIQWRHRWTGRGAQYRLRVEVIARLFRKLEGPVLQADDVVLRMLHSCAVGLRVFIHCFLACLVHHSYVQDSGNQLFSLSAPVFHVYQLLYDPGVWSFWWDLSPF